MNKYFFDIDGFKETFNLFFNPFKIIQHWWMGDDFLMMLLSLCVILVFGFMTYIFFPITVSACLLMNIKTEERIREDKMLREM